MAPSKNVGRVAAYVDKDLIERMNAVCEEAGISMSRLLRAFIEDELDSFQLLGMLGLSVKQIVSVGKALQEKHIVQLGGQSIGLIMAIEHQMSKSQKD